MAFLQHPSLPRMSSANSTTSSSPFSPRSRKQLSLFFAGASFFALSSLVTRRAINRRLLSTIPRFYQPSNHSGTKVIGEFEAVAALGLATINVTSFFLMMGGGLSWAYDIASVEELRRRITIRKVITQSELDGSDEETSKDDAEMERLVARALGRKEEQDVKRRRGDEGLEQRTKEADEVRESK